MKKTILISCLIMITCMLHAQVGINTNNPDPSAILEVKGTNGGLLIPRMTLPQRNNITLTKPGLLVYDVTLGRFIGTTGIVDSLYWVSLGPIWRENASSIFLDSANLKPIGIGTDDPQAMLHVTGNTLINDTLFF